MDASHRDIIEQLPAYSLGILEPEWVALVEAHLPTCASCRAELAAFQAATEAMAFSVPQVAAPAGSRERFARLLRDEMQAPLALLDSPNDVMPTSLPPRPAAPNRAAAVAPEEPPKRRWWDIFRNPGWALAAATFAVLLLLVGGWGLNQQSQLQQQQTLVAQLQREHDLAIQYLGDPAVQAYALAPQGNTAGAARLWVNTARSQALLVTNDLAPAPQGKVYELWLIADAPVAINVFNTGDNGAGVLTFDLPDSIDKFAVAAITVENSLVQAPTSDPILVGNI